jgi:hypothetical protein
MGMVAMGLGSYFCMEFGKSGDGSSGVTRYISDVFSEILDGGVCLQRGRKTPPAS